MPLPCHNDIYMFLTAGIVSVRNPPGPVWGLNASIFLSMIVCTHHSRQEDRNRQLESMTIADRECQKLTFTVTICGPYSCGYISEHSDFGAEI